MKIKIKFILWMLLCVFFMFSVIYYSVDYNLKEVVESNNEKITSDQMQDKELLFTSACNEIESGVNAHLMYHKDDATNLIEEYRNDVTYDGTEDNVFVIDGDELYFYQRMSKSNPNMTCSARISVTELLNRLGVSANSAILSADKKMILNDMPIEIVNKAMGALESGKYVFEEHEGVYGLIGREGQEHSIYIVGEIQSYAKDYLIIEDTMLIIMLLMLVLSVILSVSMADLFITPIRKLQRQMVKVKSGNLDAYYHVSEKNEMYYLSKTYNLMLDNMKELIRSQKEVEEQKRIAYLHVLQAQINPHFLYNTLSTLEYMAEQDGAYDVAKYIDYLSQFFRISLSDGAELIPLEKEICHCENYLKIQSLRYRDKLSYELYYEDDVKEFVIPKLTLQPLVENAIYHGIKPVKHLGKIWIRIYQKGGLLYVEINDNGIGIEEDKLNDIRMNLKTVGENQYLGLSNIYQRLSLYYSEELQFHIKSIYGGGTEICIVIPALKGEEISNV